MKIWCFFGVHEWKIIDRGPYKLSYIDTKEVKSGHWFNLQCQVCGSVKMKRCI